MFALSSWQVETKLERQARGQPVGRDVPYAAVGGLTGFSSLIDGYLALEISGSGKTITAYNLFVFLPREAKVEIRFYTCMV